MEGLSVKVAAGGAAAILLLAGCNTSPPTEIDTNAATSTSASATATLPTGPPNLHAVALTVSDLPTGWTASIDKTAIALGQAGCLKAAAGRAGTKVSNYETFAGVGGAPIFAESLAYFPPSKMLAAFSLATQALDACKTIEFKVTDKVTFNGPLARTSFPTIGLESRAYTLTATDGAHVLTEYVAIVRQANVLMMTTYASLKDPVINDFFSISTKAAAKLQ